MKVPHAAALAAISLAARMTLAATLDDVTPVFTDTTGPIVGTDETFDNADRVVIDNAGNVATISQFDGSGSNKAITLSTLSGGAYSTSVIATDSNTIPSTTGTYGSFENLGLTGGKVVFASPSGQTQAGIFTATGSSAVGTIFYGTSTTTGQTLNTTGSSDSPILYGLSSDGNVSFGLRTNGGVTSQNLYTNSASTGLNTSSIQSFNRTSGASQYLVKTVALSDGSVMAIAQASGSPADSGYGLYQVKPTGSATGTFARYSTINGYQPRQLLGATAGQSVVLGVNSSNSGAIIYQDGGNFTTLAANVTAPNRSILSTDVVGEMTAGGKAAVYMPGQGIFYHDPAKPDTSYQPLADGDTVTGSGGSTQTIVDFGANDEGATPMLNEKGWIVTGAMVGTVERPNQALIAWNPTLNLKQIIAQAGDQFKLPGDDTDTFTIDYFSELTRSDDVDITKDGLNDANQLAFGVGYEDANGNPGYAVLTTVLVPEPASLAMLGLAGGFMLRRRRINTPR